ncbi:MAG TPA: hypothetical protein PK854_12540 [Oscillospiraceae bacterium]|nr:hypothetical protein [Oscillospiraceae bacterium]HPS36079.1 hypothetical protein [Oscillospiraceae bacterium]
MPGELEKRFHHDMEQICAEARKLKYTPAYFAAMLNTHGGVMTAKKLIHTADPSYGFTKLFELKRLDLSVEAHVIKPEYEPLFTDEEREICRSRLLEYGYKG